MKDKPLLSRIVTCYKQWNYIKIWAKTEKLYNPEIEWIILNDDPEDIIPKDLEKFFKIKKIKYYSPKINSGRCVIRNYGVQIASGKWIEHIDGDDIPLPLDLNFLQEVKNEKLLFFKTGYHLEENLKHNQDSIDKFITIEKQESFYDFLLEDYRPFDPRPVGTMWKRESYMELLGYDARYESIEDLHLLWKAYQFKIPVIHFKFPKQSHLRGSPKSTPLILGPGFLNFLNLVQKSIQDSKDEKLRNEIHNFSKIFYWNSLSQLNLHGVDNLKFKIIESMKWIMKSFWRK